ncbi:MAG: OmpL47-type beta-barrel domain-containing protein [Brevinematales bacterium]
MRKLVSLLLFMVAVVGFGQQTTAPDFPREASSEKVVTPEKPVQATGSVVYNDGKLDYVGANARFVISAEDKGSGVKAIYIMVDNSLSGKYVDPIAFATEGKHTIGYRVEDNVGNLSAFKMYEVVVDLSAPETKIATDKKVVAIGDALYVGKDTAFTIVANDRYSGVKRVEYAIGKGDFESYKTAFALPAQNGLHTIRYKATDNVGNVSEVKTYTVYLDLNAPKVELSIDPAAFERDGVKYVPAGARVSVQASDAETGIAEVLYSLDNAEYVAYNFPVVLSAGTHTIKVKAIDLVGNVSEETSLTVVVDAEEPTGNLVPAQK